MSLAVAAHADARAIYVVRTSNVNVVASVDENGVATTRCARARASGGVAHDQNASRWNANRRVGAVAGAASLENVPTTTCAFVPVKANAEHPATLARRVALERARGTRNVVGTRAYGLTTRRPTTTGVSSATSLAAS